MEELVKLSREYVSLIRHNPLMGKYDNESHLNWMIDQVVINTDWPSDKKVRWLGFVIGSAVNEPGELIRDSISSIVKNKSPNIFISNINATHERIILDVCNKVVDFYDEMSENIKGPCVVFFIESIRRCGNANKASFLLGFCQARLFSIGAISVDEERERTRPMFHAAYESCGYKRPVTL